MLVNAENLNALRAGFKTSFQGGLGMASTMHTLVATIVPSSLKTQKYGWLGKFPSVREWIGARVVHALEQHDYSITEKPWELTIGVDRDDIETEELSGARANVFAQRNPIPFFGLGLLTLVPDSEILSRSDPDDLDNDGIIAEYWTRKLTEEVCPASRVARIEVEAEVLVDAEAAVSAGA